MGDHQSGVVIVADAAQSATDAAWVSAWAAAITTGIAVIAAVVAAWQIHEARQARAQTRALANEVAQPYVVAYMEADDVSPEYAHFVVKNFGQTAALNVRISSSPELRRAIYDDRSAQQRVQVQLPATISILAPAQEWRTFWDKPADRKNKERYPDRHEVTVRYSDSHNEPHTTNSILDFSTFFDRVWFDRKTLHHLATATREINTKLGKFQEDIQGGLSVFTRNGDAKDDRLRVEREQAVREAREAREAARRSTAANESP